MSNIIFWKNPTFEFYINGIDDFAIWNFLKQNVESERQCADIKRLLRILNFSKNPKTFQRIVMFKVNGSFIQ